VKPTSAAVLLTGGASSRMGRDKATILVDGEALARRTARVLTKVCDPVIEVGDGVTDLRSVCEAPRGGGPLAALLAGADALATDRPIVLVACDLPFIDVKVLRLVADHEGAGSVLPVVGARNQYACSRWSVAAIEAAREAFARGERAMRVMLDAGDVSLLPADQHARALADVDTPEDLRRVGLA
jgi:molybdopterin-guanine dinucleotide biosynthesis protein A